MPDAAPEVMDIPVNPDDPASDVVLTTAEELLREHWGLSGQVFPVGDDDGAGFLVDNGHIRYLFEIKAPEEEAELRLQHEAMRHIIRSPDGPAVPEPVAAKNGSDIVTADIAGEARILRLLTALEGDPAPISARLSESANADLGSLIAGLAKSLEDFDPPSGSGERDDDIRKAGPQTVSLLSEVKDQEARDLIARAMVASLRRVHPLTPTFRLGLTVPDMSLERLVGKGQDSGWRPTGISDIGGLARSWYVAALAKACARVLAANDGNASSILPVVTAYHAVNPLNAGEAEALWPLTIAQTALFAATAENRHSLLPDDATAAADTEERRGILTSAGSMTAAFMHASILAACAIQVDAPSLGQLLPEVDPEKIRLVDLSVTSPLLHDGNWTDPDCDWKLLARIAWDTGMGSTRYGEYRLSRSRTADEAEPETFALHVDVCLPAGTPVVAPFAGKLTRASPLLSLRGADVTLLIEGLEAQIPEGADLQTGDAIGVVAGADGAVGGLRVRLSRDPETVPPLFCSPSQAAIWRHLAPSPSALLNLDCDAPSPSPGTGIRAWREFLFDGTGRSMLDFSGKAPVIGHGNPEVAAASYRQHLLTTVAGDGHPEVKALKQALSEIAPPGLDHVVLFADAAFAIDAMAGAARTRIGQQPVIALDEPETDEPSPDGDGDSENTIATVIAIVEPSSGDHDLAMRTADARSSGSLIVIDERRTGYGRLVGVTWAVERESITADFVLAGSCDGGDLAVVFCSQDLAETLDALTAPISPVDAATARTALRVLKNEDLRADAAAISGILEEGLRKMETQFDGVIEVSGHGLLWEIQLSDASADLPLLIEGKILTGTDMSGRLLLSPPLCLGETGARRCLDHIEAALASFSR